MVSCVVSDIGLTKKINQDAIFCKHILVNQQRCTFGCVCDGLGGLSGGEIASSNAVRSLTEWFIHQYPYLYNNMSKAIDSLQNCIMDYNSRLFAYGKQQHIQTGTTISGIVLHNHKYFTVNTGDSRVYMIRNKSLSLLTKDHSYVQYEIDAGRMTEEQANNSPQQSVLVYCVGFAPNTVVDVTSGDYSSGDIFFFCSDGARHVISNAEFVSYFSNLLQLNPTTDDLKDCLTHLVELCKQRGESDNISIGAIIV